MKLKKNQGFTIVELVVTIPIISLVALGVVSLVITMFFQIMANNTRLTLLLESQTVLLSLEDEMLFTTNYGETIMSDLHDDYAPTGGWSFNANPNTLIIYETSLTAPRRDPNRTFVFKNSCDGSIAFDNVIYFTEPNADNSYSTLYRRILTPQYTTCNTNYRGQTCPADNVTPPCIIEDSVISHQVKDFQIKYYDIDNNLIDTANGGSPLDAEKATVTLDLGDELFGRQVSASSNITMRKIN